MKSDFREVPGQLTTHWRETTDFVFTIMFIIALYLDVIDEYVICPSSKVTG